MYKNARFMKIDGKNALIRVDINGVESFVPLDPENSDYAAILKMAAAGEMTIAPADEKPKP